MEGGDGLNTSASGGTPVGSRWNPTKEQISMLENLYRQGIRTPSAEQIQEITRRLMAYGQIEGKNVFYWFQNHKARQRQKQKQENNLVYFNGYSHRTSTVFPPPCPNVVCGPYYIAQSDLGFYPEYPKVLLPSGVKTRPPMADKVEKSTKPCGGTGDLRANQGRNIMRFNGENEESIKNINHCNQGETLDLFPLHPTGILQGRTETSTSLASPSADQNSTIFSNNSGISCINLDREDSGDHQPLFDFFGPTGP